jgi:hypothetical protein
MAKKSIEKETKVVSENEALKTPVVTGEVLKRPQTKIEIMKAKLNSQPRVRIIIPKEQNEAEGAFETVQLNGYTLQIKKGVYVEVPEQVADVIMASNKQINDAYVEAAKKVSDSERMEFNN